MTIASTGKDPATGRMLTHEYRVEGPVMIFLTTTAIDLDEELLNRCLVLTVNEDREQTQAIHRVQREAQTLEGLLQRRDRDAVLQAASQRAAALEPVFVVESLRPRADLPGQPDADAARPYEVPDAHPRHRPAASASAATARQSSTEAARWSISRSRWRTSPSPTGSRTRCWAVRSTSCRRRRGGCCC